MTTDTKVSELPELPGPEWKATDGVSPGVYSAAQVREYGMSCHESALARQEADKVAAPVWQEPVCYVRWHPKHGYRWDGFHGDYSRTGWTSKPLYAAPPAAQADDDWHLRGYAYASKQATTCAGCGEYKHTPLRIDAMGGYVCLTCIDNKLSSLLGEFGYTAAQAVDLGQFREAVEYWRDSAERGDFYQQRNRADRLLALIDQQAGGAK